MRKRFSLGNCMRVIYISHIDIRSPRAHVHNTLKTCEAMQAAGCTVTWVNPDVEPTELKAILCRHDIATPFHVVFLHTVRADEQNQSSRLKRLFAIIRMNVSLLLYLLKHHLEFDVVYYRYHLLIVPALFAKWILNKKIIFETHYVYLAKPVAQALTRSSVRMAHGVVAITHALRAFYGLLEDSSIMAPCHAAETNLVPDEPISVLRERLKIPHDAVILCYTGSLGATIQGISYEVETLVEILPKLPSSCISVIVGARDDRPDGEDLRRLAERLGVSDRVIIRSWTDRATVMSYLAASDILMMPRVGVAPGSSPSKMFDYLAIGKPIIAAATPPVVEILEDRKNALLVNADHPEEWVVAVKQILDDPAMGLQIAVGAQSSAAEYTWSARGKKIQAFISKIYGRS